MGTCESSYQKSTRSLSPRRRWHWFALIGLLVILPSCAKSRPPGPGIHLPSKAPAAAPDVTGVAIEEPVYHRVQPGESLWSISRKYGVTVEELVSLNSLSDPNKLSVNQRIQIPGTGGGNWAWPVRGGEILSRFGVSRGAHRHRGIDIRGQSGQQVRAVRAGRVVSNSRISGYGKTVVVDHGNGIRSLYAHNSTVLVQPGEPVRRGQPIARVGRTGNASTYHCHLEIRRGNVPVNPLRYLKQDRGNKTVNEGGLLQESNTESATDP